MSVSLEKETVSVDSAGSLVALVSEFVSTLVSVLASVVSTSSLIDVSEEVEVSVVVSSVVSESVVPGIELSGSEFTFFAGYAEYAHPVELRIITVQRTVATNLCILLFSVFI